ncbi:MAG: hypothetical protein ACO4CS_16825 [bacterium]
MVLDQTLLAERYVAREGIVLHGKHISTILTEVEEWRNEWDLHYWLEERVPSTEGNRWWVPREVVENLVSREDLWIEGAIPEELLSEWVFFYEFY